ncbi:hypothetical protein ARMGADRAFT_1087296 [Armillaria gallica]|uniref:Uncharacterized protein n=1 Tax=Armillaria gallica TaxID=47427 RepID=A0A2H3D2U9_ARMGA|nr:hypothetical protein ARMGADRAFT_1087296 [Armillaria gallica]
MIKDSTRVMGNTAAGASGRSGRMGSVGMPYIHSYVTADPTPPVSRISIPRSWQTGTPGNTLLSLQIWIRKAETPHQICPWASAMNTGRLVLEVRRANQGSAGKQPYRCQHHPYVQDGETRCRGCYHSRLDYPRSPPQTPGGDGKVGGTSRMYKMAEAAIIQESAIRVRRHTQVLMVRTNTTFVYHIVRRGSAFDTDTPQTADTRGVALIPVKRV